MKGKPFLLASVFISILVLNVPAQTGPAITMITSNDYEDSHPQINGNILVWQGYKDGDWEIFLFDITSEQIIQVTDNEYADITPQTDGDYIVWLGASNTGGEIYLYDIADGMTTRLTHNDDIDAPPQIADGRVVWASQKVTDSVQPGEIMLYHVKSKTTEQLTHDTLDDSAPRINDRTVVWIRTDAMGDTTLYLYDLITKSTVQAPAGYVWQSLPQKDGELTVSTRHDGTDREVFVYNSSLKTTEQITDNVFEDRNPRISGGLIVWEGGAGPASEIFLNAAVSPVSSNLSQSSSTTTPGNGGSGGGGCFIGAAAF